MKNCAETEQAINAYHKITASPEFRELERLREKARHDEAQALPALNIPKTDRQKYREQQQKQ